MGVMKEIMAWNDVLLCDWSRVELEKVMDPVLSGDPKHKYVARFALSILNQGIAAHTALQAYSAN